MLVLQMQKMFGKPMKKIKKRVIYKKGIDNKTTRREGFRRLRHLFTYVLFSLSITIFSGNKIDQNCSCFNIEFKKIYIFCIEPYMANVVCKILKVLTVEIKKNC